MLEKTIARVRRSLFRTEERPTARRTVGRVSRIFRDVVELEKLRAGNTGLRLAAHPIDPLLEQAMSRQEATAAKRSVELAVLDAEGPVVAWCDPDRIGRVLFHLVDNAIGASPVGGLVTLSARVRGAAIVVSVTDQGQGIAIEHWPYLFEQWRSPNHEDHGDAHDGFGLALCRALIEAHGGRIWVVSQLRAGTTFHFALPTPAVSS